jgi:glycosyltransferase involved in cell wall biosynthesis
MRILVLTHHAVKDVLGEYEYNMCKHLEEQKVDVFDVALFGTNSHYCSHARIAKKPIGFLSDLLEKRIGELFCPDMISELKNKYDVIHLQGAFWSFIPLQAIIWKKLLRISTPTIMTTHAFVPDKQTLFGKSIINAIKNKKLSLIFWGLRCLPYTGLDKIICQSELERKFVIKEFKIDETKVVTIPNGVDMRRFEQPSYDFKKVKNLKRKYFIFFVGQLIPQKGIKYLLQAVKFLKEEKKIDCDVGLASYVPKDDVLGEAEKLGIKENVKIYPNLPETDLIAAYKSCDIFVLPSLIEGLPTVVLEAMAAKKPVVATNVSGNPYLIKNGFNGFMVDPKDSLALAKRIEEVLTNEKLSKQIAENGYQTVIKDYTWPVVASKILKQYNELKQTK